MNLFLELIRCLAVAWFTFCVTMAFLHSTDKIRTPEEIEAANKKGQP